MNFPKSRGRGVSVSGVGGVGCFFDGIRSAGSARAFSVLSDHAVKPISQELSRNPFVVQLDRLRRDADTQAVPAVLTVSGDGPKGS